MHWKMCTNITITTSAPAMCSKGDTHRKLADSTFFSLARLAEMNERSWAEESKRKKMCYYRMANSDAVMAVN